MTPLEATPHAPEEPASHLISMEIFQIIISSIFSIIGAASILFVAARAYSIGSDVSEIKELLKEIRRDAQNRADLSLSGGAAPGLEPGNWPSVTDPRYNAGQERLPYALRLPQESSEEDETTSNKPAGW